MIQYYVLLLLMTVLGSVASMFLKQASGADSLWAMIKNKNLYLGGGLYLSSALINVYVLRFLNYSIVLPLTAFTYVWTMLISRIFLKERITIKKIVGVGMIIIGAVLVAI